MGLIWLHELCLHVSYNDVTEYTLPLLVCECCVGQDPLFWGTPKLHKEGENVLICVCV